MKALARVAAAAVGGLTFLGAIGGATPVLAACHHFSVSATPTSVMEGQSITVTVSRDAMLAPSNITISTVDGTAKAGEDYEAFSQVVNFTTSTSMQFTVKTLDDPEEPGAPTEAFNLHLSAPGGCAVNPNYIVDKDVTITINDPDYASAAAGASLGPGQSPGLPASGAAPEGLPLYVHLTLAALVVAAAGTAAWWVRQARKTPAS